MDMCHFSISHAPLVWGNIMQDVMILFGGFLSLKLEVLSKALVSLMLSGPIYCRRSPIYCFHVSSISSVNCASIGVAEDLHWRSQSIRLFSSVAHLTLVNTLQNNNLLILPRPFSYLSQTYYFQFTMVSTIFNQSHDLLGLVTQFLMASLIV